MKTIVIAFSIILLASTSCKSDETKIKEANELTNKFVNEILLENYDAAYKIYPGFRKMGQFWIPREFKISSSSMETDGKISIYCSYSRGNKNSNQLKFILGYNDAGDLRIENSKGLSSFNDSPIFDYCKMKGYFSTKENASIDSDLDITKVCKLYELEFDLLVSKCARYISENVIMDKSQSTLERGYLGDSFSGSIAIINNTAFDLYSGSVDFNLLLMSGDNICDKKPISNIYSINAYSTINHEILYEQNTCRANKYIVKVEVSNRENFGYEVVKKLIYAESLE